VSILSKTRTSEEEKWFLQLYEDDLYVESLVDPNQPYFLDQHL
jgi:hypothetical protein